jgi:hypothetical protein
MKQPITTEKEARNLQEIQKVSPGSHSTSAGFNCNAWPGDPSPATNHEGGQAWTDKTL